MVAWLGRGLGGEDDDGGGGGGDGRGPDAGDPGDGDGPDGLWRPEDERAFWDHVSRRPGPRAPVAG